MTFIKLWDLEWRRHRLFIGLSYVAYATIKALLLGLSFQAWREMVTATTSAMGYHTTNVDITLMGLDLLIVSLVGIFSLYIWLVDWYGKGHFGTRWMLFPIKRYEMYLAKWSTSFLFFLGFLVIDVVEVGLYYITLKRMLPVDLGSFLRFTHLFGDQGYGFRAGTHFLPIQWQQFVLLGLLASLSILLAFDLLIYMKSLPTVQRIGLGLVLLLLVLSPLWGIPIDYSGIFSYATLGWLSLLNVIALLGGYYVVTHRLGL